jgi:cyanophycin synthetase
VGLTYSLATACLRLGATCIGPTADLAAAITQHRPTHARLLPFQAESLVSGLPAGFRKPGDLTLNIGAAPLSAALRKKLLARVASRIVYSYGSNETGIIGEFGADGLCTAYAGVELEIVDPRDAPVADGRLGQVRIRTPDMVSNYLGNPEATARAFRDGWFYTGDAAIMPAPGRFRLLGRADEMLNLGGRKFIPDEVEKLIASRVVLQDVGVTSIRNAEGVEVACIALVVKDTAKAREASERVVKCLPRGFGRTIIRAVGSIPRTAETGKVRRQELRKLFLRK